jgi:hypothetical protein
MKTLYAACLSRLGLSQTGAAAMHNNRVDTVKSWSSGRNPVPQGVWNDLRRYEALLVDRSEMMLEQWQNAGSRPIEIDTSEADDTALIAAADFVLNSSGPVHNGQTAATRMARQARRPN